MARYTIMNNFYKTQAAYKILDIINNERESLKSELVAYSNDPVRYKRRFRMLLNLAQYEVNILTKLQNFSSDDTVDFNAQIVGLVKLQVKAVVDRDA